MSRVVRLAARGGASRWWAGAETRVASDPRRHIKVWTEPQICTNVQVMTLDTPFVSSASALDPVPGLNDEAMGQMARATLEDLARQSTYEGKLLTLVRTLRHLEEFTRDETVRRTQPRGEWGPGWDECEAIYQAGGREEPPRNPPGTRSPQDPRILLTAESFERIQGTAMRQVERLMEKAPGSLSARLRRMAFVTGTALMVCQWGAFEAAEKPLEWCSAILNLLRSQWDTEDKKNAHRLDILGVIAIMGSIAASRRYVTLASAIARRLTAELAAMARAAARREGMEEADPIFEGRPDVVESLTGMDRTTAEASLNDFARALEKTLAGMPQTPPPAATRSRKTSRAAQ